MRAPARRPSTDHEMESTADMPDAAPHRLHISRRYGSTLHRAPRTEDGRLVPAGLLARGSSAFSGLPTVPRKASAVACAEQARRLQLRGQPRNDRREACLPCSLLIHRRLADGETGTFRGDQIACPLVKRGKGGWGRLATPPTGCLRPAGRRRRHLALGRDATASRPSRSCRAAHRPLPVPSSTRRRRASRDGDSPPPPLRAWLRSRR